MYIHVSMCECVYVCMVWWVLVPRGVLEEKERGTLQRWFDMIDWQGVGKKEEQQAQGGMKYYVRGQKRTKKWVKE
jgi:hypothetical protein